MSKNKKIVVWDLFGGGQNSVYNTLKENNMLDKYDVYTFDVTQPSREKQFILDLSQNDICEKFEEMIKNNTIQKPDIIVASPLCQSFSCILNMKGGGTCFWKLNDEKTLLVERSVEEFERLKNGFTKRLDAETQLFLKRLGERCINNTLKIIDYFEPEVWYIENPKSSLMWKYIELNNADFVQKWNAVKNEASYGKYGYLTTKLTYFMSNVNITLKKGKIDPPYYIKEVDGVKYYVLKDDENVKLKYDFDSRVLGVASMEKMVRMRKQKTGLAGYDFIAKTKEAKEFKQKNKMQNEQICEAGPLSAIPHDLIKDIFSAFESELDKK